MSKCHYLGLIIDDRVTWSLVVTEGVIAGRRVLYITWRPTGVPTPVLLWPDSFPIPLCVATHFYIVCTAGEGSRHCTTWPFRYALPYPGLQATFWPLWKRRTKPFFCRPEESFGILNAYTRYPQHSIFVGFKTSITCSWCSCLRGSVNR